MSSGDINYMENLSLRPLAEKIRREILSLGPAINAYQRLNYVVFDYIHSQVKGISRIAALRFYKQFFRFHAHRIDKNGRLNEEAPYPYIEIMTGLEDYSEVFAVVIKSYKNIGGKI